MRELAHFQQAGTLTLVHEPKLSQSKGITAETKSALGDRMGDVQRASGIQMPVYKLNVQIQELHSHRAGRRNELLSLFGDAPTNLIQTEPEAIQKATGVLFCIHTAPRVGQVDHFMARAWRKCARVLSLGLHIKLLSLTHGPNTKGCNHSSILTHAT